MPVNRDGSTPEVPSILQVGPDSGVRFNRRTSSRSVTDGMRRRAGIRGRQGKAITQRTYLARIRTPPG